MSIATASLIDILFPKRHALTSAALALAGSLLIAFCAQVAVPLPFTPVPITGQTLAVLVVAATLGPRLGPLSVFAYLLEGMAGLPVFAGGTFGIMHVLGATGGYLWGFVLAAFVVGWLCQRGWDRHVLTAGAAMLLGNVTIYMIGLPWLTLFVGAGHALDLGLLPFLPGDLLKIVLAMGGLPGAWRLIENWRGDL